MENNTIYAKSRKPKDVLMMILIYLTAFLTVALLVLMIAYIFVKGFPHVSFKFLISVTSAMKQTVGIAGNIVNTLYLIALTLLIATPIGVGSAIYLNEYAKEGKFLRLIEFTTETLSGIPSIIFGLFGTIFFREVCHLGYSILTGAFTLSIMILPLITRNTQEALRRVPDSYRHGAVGLGAPRWYMIRTILIPSAMQGIITGILLAVGRIVGESAALLFTAGSGYLLPKSAMGYLTKILEPGGSLTIQLYLSMFNAQYDVAFAIAVVLFIIVLGINGLAKLLGRKLGNQM